MQCCQCNNDDDHDIGYRHTDVTMVSPCVRISCAGTASHAHALSVGSMPPAVPFEVCGQLAAYIMVRQLRWGHLIRNP
eukprot:1865309-Pyramimonas_sp.AAC.1